MGIILKIAKTTGKIIGTTVVGGLGVATSIVGTAAPNEVRKSLDQVSNSFFSVAKNIWNSNATGDEMKRSFESIQNGINSASLTLSNLRDDQIRETIENPRIMKERLKHAGKDPALADNPAFMKAMKEKYHYLF